MKSVKKKYLIIISIIGGILATSIVWGLIQYNQTRRELVYLDNIYQKSFLDLVDNVNNIQTKLSKVMVASTSSRNIVLLSDIWRQANNASLNLAQLPISNNTISKTSKFINQVGDYCYYLTQKSADGTKFSDADIKNLNQLSKNSILLNNELVSFENQLNSKGMKWGEIAYNASNGFRKSSNSVTNKRFTVIEKNSAEYPSLMYDGPFSDSLQKSTPRGLGTSKVSDDQAKTIAVNFIGNGNVKSIKKANDGNGDIKTWGFEGILKTGNQSFVIHVTKTGGQVIWMDGNAGTLQKKLSVDQCVQYAVNFLKGKGYPDMQPTYKQYYDSIAVVNFAVKQKNVIIYPDLIKVKVSMQDGRILGFESRNYIMSHTSRNIDKPKLTEEQAKKIVSVNLKISSSRLAIIPTDTKGEKLCYEFEGTYNNSVFFVYINALTGKEENVLKLINTKNGSLVL